MSVPNRKPSPNMIRLIVNAHVSTGYPDANPRSGSIIGANMNFERQSGTVNCKTPHHGRTTAI